MHCYRLHSFAYIHGGRPGVKVLAASASTRRLVPASINETQHHRRQPFNDSSLRRLLIIATFVLNHP